MESYIVSKKTDGLSLDEITDALYTSLEGVHLRNVLIIPPDFTRFYSNAGLITNIYYQLLTQRGCSVDIIPALGTHEPLTPEETREMFGDIPQNRFLVHNWRTDVTKLGEIDAGYMAEITDGLWREAISVEINRLVMDEKYDRIISIGQVVPHEVVGMSNHAKNLFVGVGGSEMINKSHMVGAVCGLERMMGRADTPVRRIFDYGMEHYLHNRPITFVLTVTTAPRGVIHTHGLFVGEGRECFLKAAELAQEKNIDFVPKAVKKCVVYLPHEEFKSTWLGNKAIYRTRMAIADDGDLIILAPGVRRFGEDETIDALIRKYGYIGREEILRLFNENDDLRQNMSAAAHLIHGSSDGRFRITYAAGKLAEEEIASVGFIPGNLDRLTAKYDVNSLKYGYNVLDDGEQVFFIPNPALGLWINRERMND